MATHRQRPGSDVSMEANSTSGEQCNDVDDALATRTQRNATGSLNRNQVNADRTQGVGSLTRGQHPPELLPVPSEICQRDTRFFTALFIIILISQVVHTISLTRRNIKSRVDMDLDPESSGVRTSMVLFPLLSALSIIPAVLWLVANAWETCQGRLWAKLKRRGGFIAYHVSVVVSTILYATYIVYLMASNFNSYLDAYSTNATCYCTTVNGTQLGNVPTLYQCRCHVPEEDNPWLLTSHDLQLVDDAMLQTSGSNYTGDVTTLLFNSSAELHMAEEMYFPEFTKLVYCIQLCVLVVALRTMCWGWTSDYTGRDMTHLDASITVPYLREHRDTLLQYSLYWLMEAVDVYSLLSVLLDHGRHLASNRPLADGVMAVCGVGSYVLHVVTPLAYVRWLPAVESSRPESRTNKVLVFLSSTQNTILVMRALSAALNVVLFVLRVALFRRLDDVSAVFVLFVVKEFYVVWQKGCEFFVEWWDSQREEHFDDD